MFSRVGEISAIEAVAAEPTGSSSAAASPRASSVPAQPSELQQHQHLGSNASAAAGHKRAAKPYGSGVLTRLLSWLAGLTNPMTQTRVGQLRLYSTMSVIDIVFAANPHHGIGAHQHNIRNWRRDAGTRSFYCTCLSGKTQPRS